MSAGTPGAENAPAEVVRLPLAATGTDAAREARTFVRVTAEHWGMPEAAGDRMAQLTCELLSSTAPAARPAELLVSEVAGGGRVTVRRESAPTADDDGDDVLPGRRELLDGLADEWGEDASSAWFVVRG